MSEERIQALETAMAHQDQQIQELSDAALEQAREIARLKNELGRTKDKIEEIEHSTQSSDEALSPSEAAARDKPPHY